MMRLETLLRIYYLRHGFECADAFLTQPLSLMAFENLQKLRTDPHGPRGEAARSSLILAAKGLWDQGQNFWVARTTLCVLRRHLEQKDFREAELPLLDREINIRLESGTREHQQIREVRSRWPPTLASMTDDPEEHRLSTLVKQHMRIHMDSDDERDEDEDEEDDNIIKGPTVEGAAALQPADRQYVVYGSPAATLANGYSHMRSPS